MHKFCACYNLMAFYEYQIKQIDINNKELQVLLYWQILDHNICILVDMVTCVSYFFNLLSFLATTLTQSMADLVNYLRNLMARRAEKVSNECVGGVIPACRVIYCFWSPYLPTASGNGEGGSAGGGEGEELIFYLNLQNNCSRINLSD